jgi:multiple sugar transport system substrate-binding protein
MRALQLKELAAPKGKYDLVAMLSAWKTEYVTKKLLTDLDREQQAGRLHLEDVKDVVPAYLTLAGKVGGPKGYLDGPGAHLYALPVNPETSIFAYRTDLFKKHGLQAPATYDDLLHLITVLKEREPGMQPLCSRGARGHQVTHAWLLHFNSYGGEVFDNNWRPQVQSAAGVKAVQMLQTVHAASGDGILKNSFADMCNAFITGRAAMYLDASTIFELVNDPVKTPVQDKIAYALHPAGTVHASETGGFALAMPKNAPNQAEALRLLGWLTSKEQDRQLARRGGTPIRQSTMRDIELQIIYPEYAVLSQQLQYANPNWRPIIPEWAVINEQILGVLVHDAVAGHISAEEAMEQAQQKITTLMRQSGRYK